MNISTSLNDWDGSFTGCLGKNCPDACCNVKKVRTAEGKLHKYNTTVNYAEEQLIKAAGADVSIETINVPERVGLGGIYIRTQGALTGCLGSMGCKIAHVKPLMCKFYPFGLEADEETILDLDDCPGLIAIASDESNVKRILEMRKELGLSDNGTYIDVLLEVLKNLGVKPDWKFKNDTVYMEAIS